VSKGKIFLYSGLLIIALLLTIKHELLYYAYVQAKGQLEIVMNARQVEELMADPTFPDSLKAKLKIIGNVKKYAIEELGLKGEKNYTTYFDQEGRELMWVVSACKPFELESYEWGFPILGSFSYKGFFRYDMAEKERDKLRDQGLDANIRTAGGWSTLGILKDPVLSNMLNRDPGSLSDLIIHELTHGTIFIKDSLEFNENLASFIGNEGARLFLSENYGDSSTELTLFNTRIRDQKIFTNYVLEGATRLDSLYKSFIGDMSFEAKLELKVRIINEFMAGTQELPVSSLKYKDYFNDFTPDNTFFMSYLRYRGGQSIFEEAWRIEHQGNLAEYINALKAQFAR
jgi:predicted aminopeptidase